MYKVKTTKTQVTTYNFNPTIGISVDDAQMDRIVRTAAREHLIKLEQLKVEDEGLVSEKVTEIWRDGKRIYPRKVKETKA
jgi:hypothetical protein